MKIHHAAPIHEQGSSFQGHFSKINHFLEQKAVLLKHYEEKNVASATHNIWAYRVESPTPGVHYSDGGEFGAGFSLIKLFCESNVTGMIIVTRWYGGVPLGPKRFTCVEEAALCKTRIIMCFHMIPELLNF